MYQNVYADNEDEGQHQSESQVQSPSANGISDSGISTQNVNVQYTTPGQLGAGHAMVRTSCLVVFSSDCLKRYMFLQLFDIISPH